MTDTIGRAEPNLWPAEQTGASVPNGPTRAEHADENAGDDEPGYVNLAMFIGVMAAIGLLGSWWAVAAIGLLALMLFMHELGHYLTARASGMQVTEFFLGFGPKVWSFTRGETEYGIKAIWAGAYVRITGLNTIEEVDPALEHRTYRAKSYPRRMWVITAGSVMHFLMAFVGLIIMFAVVGSYGTSDPDPSDWIIGTVVQDTAAQAMGMEEGDRITAVNGTDVSSFDDLAAAVGPLAGQSVEFIVDRDGDVVALEGDLGVNSGDVVNRGFGLTLLSPVGSEPWQVASVADDSNASEFGFETGDLLMSAGGVTVTDRPALAEVLFERDNNAIVIDVERRGQPVALTGEVALDLDQAPRGFLGIGPQVAPAAPVGLGEAVQASAKDFAWISGRSLAIFDPDTWISLFRPNQPDEQVSTGGSGDVVVSDGSGGAGRPMSAVGAGRLWVDADSAEHRIFIFVLVNISIGIINLAPVLPLDGGHAVIATYERLRELITRRPHRVDAARLIPVTWVVVVLLVVVGVWSIALDVFSWPPI